MYWFPSSRQRPLISYHITGTNRERNQNHASRQSVPVVHEWHPQFQETWCSIPIGTAILTEVVRIMQAKPRCFLVGKKVFFGITV